MRISRKLFAQSVNSNNVPQNQNNNFPGADKNLQIEQMKLQRQVMMNIRLRQKMQADERMSQSRRISQLQKMEQKKAEQESKDRINTSKITTRNRELEKDNTHLYKSRPSQIPPVPMKKTI